MASTSLDRVVDFDDCDVEEVDLEGEDDTLRYFKPLMSKEKQERSTYLDNLIKSINLWSNVKDNIIAQHLLMSHLPTVLRLTLTCPFNDVRHTLQLFLQNLQVCFNECCIYMLVKWLGCWSYCTSSFI